MLRSHAAQLAWPGYVGVAVSSVAAIIGAIVSIHGLARRLGAENNFIKQLMSITRGRSILGNSPK